MWIVHVCGVCVCGGVIEILHIRDALQLEVIFIHVYHHVLLHCPSLLCREHLETKE